MEVNESGPRRVRLFESLRVRTHFSCQCSVPFLHPLAPYASSSNTSSSPSLLVTQLTRRIEMDFQPESGLSASDMEFFGTITPLSPSRRIGYEVSAHATQQCLGLR